MRINFLMAFVLASAVWGCSAIREAEPGSDVSPWKSDATLQFSETINERSFIIVADSALDASIGDIEPDTSWSPLSSRQRVPIPSRMQTGPMSSLTLLLAAPDGVARILLDSNTEIRIDEHAHMRISDSLDSGLLELHVRRGTLTINSDFSGSDNWMTTMYVESENAAVGGRTSGHHFRFRVDGSVWVASGELILIDHNISDGRIHDIWLNPGEAYDPITHDTYRLSTAELEGVFGVKTQ